MINIVDSERTKIGTLGINLNVEVVELRFQVSNEFFSLHWVENNDWTGGARDIEAAMQREDFIGEPHD